MLVAHASLDVGYTRTIRYCSYIPELGVMEIIFGVLEALHTKLQSVSAAHADGTSLMKTETWVKIILVELKEKSPQCITKEMSQIRITTKHYK